jgi:hypothetical protein
MLEMRFSHGSGKVQKSRGAAKRAILWDGVVNPLAGTSFCVGYGFGSESALAAMALGASVDEWDPWRVR